MTAHFPRLGTGISIKKSDWVKPSYKEYPISLVCGCMVPNATFNNISIISWRWKKPEKTTDLSEGIDKLYHIMLHRVHLACVWFDLTTLVVIGTDNTCSFNPTTIRSRPRRPLIANQKHLYNLHIVTTYTNIVLPSSV